VVQIRTGLKRCFILVLTEVAEEQVELGAFKNGEMAWKE